MDLQITAFLLFILFTAVTKGHSRFCYECIGLEDCPKRPVMCPNETKCESTMAVSQYGDFSLKSEVKKCTLNCRDMSMNLGVVKSTTTCCDTFLCNYKDAPDPRTLVPNGRKCYYCEGKSCSNIVSCSGGEDRCITATGTWTGRSAVVKGCVTQSFCNTPCECMKDISCCEGDLCNSDTRVIQSATRSFLDNGDESDFQIVTQGIIQSVGQSFRDEGAWRAKQSSTYNGAQRFIQSFLFLCSSLLVFILII